MKNKTAIIFAILILLFVAYKSYLLYQYKVEERDIDTSEIFRDNISITSQEYKGNLFTYEGISFKNDFKNYTKNEHNWYIKKDKNNDVVAALYITKMEQYHHLLTDGNLKVINGDSNEVVNKLFNEEDKIAFKEENDIKDDMDLMNYIKDHYYLRNTIITNHRKIKQNYIINSFVNIALPTFSKITEIKGDLKGYILHASENIRQVHILSGDYQYIMSLVGEELVTNEYITSLLETVKIK